MLAISRHVSLSGDDNVELLNDVNDAQLTPTFDIYVMMAIG